MDLMPGEFIQWQGVTELYDPQGVVHWRASTAITVTNQRLAKEDVWYGALRLQYLPLERIDHVDVGRYRRPIGLKALLLCLLLGIVGSGVLAAWIGEFFAFFLFFPLPVLLYLLFWFFTSHVYASRFRAGGQEIRLMWLGRKQDPVAMELLAAVEAARQSAVSLNPPSEPLKVEPPPEPLQVALNP